MGRHFKLESYGVNLSIISNNILLQKCNSDFKLLGTEVSISSITSFKTQKCISDFKPLGVDPRTKGHAKKKS